MAVIAVFTYQVERGRMADFMNKLRQAASPRFNSPTMPKDVRLFRPTVPGPDTETVVLMLWYENMAAYGERTDFESNNPDWRELFEARPDSPETLISVELLTEIATL